MTTIQPVGQVLIGGNDVWLHAVLGAILLLAALALAARGAPTEPASIRTVTPEDADVDRTS